MYFFVLVDIKVNLYVSKNGNHFSKFSNSNFMHKFAFTHCGNPKNSISMSSLYFPLVNLSKIILAKNAEFTFNPLFVYANVQRKHAKNVKQLISTILMIKGHP